MLLLGLVVRANDLAGRHLLVPLLDLVGLEVGVWFRQGEDVPGLATFAWRPRPFCGGPWQPLCGRVRRLRGVASTVIVATPLCRAGGGQAFCRRSRGGLAAKAGRRGGEVSGGGGEGAGGGDALVVGVVTVNQVLGATPLNFAPAPLGSQGPAPSAGFVTSSG